MASCSQALRLRPRQDLVHVHRWPLRVLQQGGGHVHRVSGAAQSLHEGGARSVAHPADFRAKKNLKMKKMLERSFFNIYK